MDPMLAARIEDFLHEEAELLDSRRWDAWLALFTADGLYWVPADPAQDDPDAAPSHVYERRPALDARIERLRDARVIPQLPASRTSRLLGRVRVQPLGGAEYEARARFHVVEARMLGEADDALRLHAGQARWRLVPEGGGFRIRVKRVDLVDADAGLHGTTILL